MSPLIRLIRDSEFVRQKHQIKNVNRPIPVHVDTCLVRPKPLRHQRQIEDIHYTIPVHIRRIRRLHTQIHLPVQIRQCVLRVHQPARYTLHLLRQRYYLCLPAVVVGIPPVGVFADVKARDVLIVQCGFGADGTPQIRIQKSYQ